MLKSFFLSLLVLSLSGPLFADPKVLVTIKPLALLVAPLLSEEQVADLEILLPAHASPHSYSMRISDRSKIEEADLVIWLGPELEAFLAKVLGTSSKQAAIGDLSGLIWPKPLHANEGEHVHSRDPHIWLNSDNGHVIVDALSERLAALDPENAGLYEQRAKAFQERLLALDDELKALMSPVATKGFFVFHDGFGHWVEHFGLNQLGAVSSGDRRPGAAHLYKLQKIAQENAVVCLFGEPSSQNVWARRMAKDIGAQYVELDALAAGQGLNSYESLLRELAVDFSRCLAE